MSYKKKYFVVDNVIIGANHVIGNAGYINYIQNLHAGHSEVTFFADSSHINNVMSKVSQVNGNQISYTPIEVINPQSGIVNKLLSWKKKLSLDQKIIKSILQKAREEKVELVLFCTIIPSNLYRFQKIFAQYPDVKIAITLHGEIEYLYKKDLTKFQQLNAFFYRKAFNNTLDNIRYIVISKLIREKLLDSKLLPAERLIYIEHPINEYSRDNVTVPEMPIIAQLGVASKRKGSEKIFELAELMQDKIRTNNIEFQVIGKLYNDVIPYRNNWVNILSENNQHISQAVYESKINNATFAINLVTGDDYIYRLSGSLIDSIQYQLPLIALKHEFVGYMFREGGDIGYMCETLDEMKQVLKDISEKKLYILERYPQQVANLKSLAQHFYDANIVSIFRKNMAEVGWQF